ncbi:MAG: hypothetical protein PHS44_02105 [Candidatus Dojkabacteria bacterium]|nr:hypothetical protein [Candidatus Dojkabacteria bacterium]
MEINFPGEMWQYADGIYKGVVSRPAFADSGRYLGQEFIWRTELALHPFPSDTIVIIIPGMNGGVDGYENKYEKIARVLVERRMGAVVRMDNKLVGGLQEETFLVDNLRFVINYVLQNSEQICGRSCPSIYLMGYSAGAGAVAAIAHEYEFVKRVLLIATAGNIGRDKIEFGLRLFRGKVMSVIGEDDEILDSQATVQILAELTALADVSRHLVLPGCDHRFSGYVGGRLLSASVFWAFGDLEGEVPLAKNGIYLYD